MTGPSAPLASGDAGIHPADEGELYPPLRQLPRLAVPYADLYRRVRVQETIFELLTQQYELARIEEAKDLPVIAVIDPAGVPEKKSYPPRLMLVLLLTFIFIAATAIAILPRNHWSGVDSGDPRKKLANEVFRS